MNVVAGERFDFICNELFPYEDMNNFFLIRSLYIIITHESRQELMFCQCVIM